MILYVISVGLSVTMGLMGFVNLAHGVFAMAGGFILSTVMARLGMPFPLALLIAAVSVAVASIVLERLLYSRLYAEGELAQVLFCIGLIFASMAVARLLYGDRAVPVFLPDYLRGQLHLLGRDFPTYRVFLIVFSRRSDCSAVVRRGKDALGRDGARRGRQPRDGAIGGHQHQAALHGDRSRSAAASPASAARSAPTSCRCTGPTRSSTWCTS